MWTELLEIVSFMDILSLVVGLVSVVLGISAIAMSRKSEKAISEMHGAATSMNRDTQAINRDTHRMAMLAEQFALHPLEMDMLKARGDPPGQVRLRKDRDVRDEPIAFTHEDIATVMQDLERFRIPSNTVIIDELPAFLEDSGQHERSVRAGDALAVSPRALLQLRIALARHGIRLALFPEKEASDA